MLWVSKIGTLIRKLTLKDDRQNDAFLHGKEHLITLANDQLDAQILIHLLQSVSDRPVHRCTGRSLTESDDTRCCINTI